MKFRIDSKILERFPGLSIGVVVARGIDNKGISEEIIKLIRNEEEGIRSGFSRETLSENPKIAAWRKAYSSFGAKPKKNRCSVENLMRMVLEGTEIRHISRIVDIYNYISMKYMIPVGGDDTDRVDGDITLRFAKGNEPFTELNSDETTNPREGEVVYSDSKEILCRRWNWRECDKSKMAEDTKNATLVTEGLPPFTKEDVGKIIEELSELVRKHCGGEVRTLILNKDRPEAEI